MKRRDQPNGAPLYVMETGDDFALRGHPRALRRAALEADARHEIEQARGRLEAQMAALRPTAPPRPSPAIPSEGDSAPSFTRRQVLAYRGPGTPVEGDAVTLHPRHGAIRVREVHGLPTNSDLASRIEAGMAPALKDVLGRAIGTHPDLE